MIDGRRLRAAASMLLPAGVLAMGLAVRLAPWEHVFTERGVRFRADTDPYYHVLRAERLLDGAPGAPWRDPELGWPTGADIPWPPLFDAAIAAAGALSAPDPGREQLARAAALLPVALAVVTLVLLAALGRRALADRAVTWAAVALAAVIPAFSQHGEVGRPDQHVAELLLFVAMLLAQLAATQGGRAGPFLLAGLIPVAFWTWMGSAVLLAVPVAFTGLWHVFAPAADASASRAARALCIGGMLGAALLAATLLVLGPTGALARATATGVSGLHVAIAAGAGAVGGLLLLAGRVRRGVPSLTRRASEAVLASALPVAAALSLAPALREGAVQGLTALLASNPWYAAVGEFAPLFPGEQPLGTELVAAMVSLGFTIPAAALAIPGLVGRWRSGLRREVTFLAILFAIFVPLAFARQRFMAYALVPLALWNAEGLRWLAGRMAGRGHVLVRGMVFAAGVAVIAAPTLPAFGNPWSSLSEGDEDALRWLANVPAPRGREGVLSEWSLGHAIQYFAGKPVVASPFGTEGGPGAMDDWAAVWFAREARVAEAILARRRVGFVVLREPLSELTTATGLAPPELNGLFGVVEAANGARQTEIVGGALQFVVARLYYADGRALPNGAPELCAFRLLYETAPGDQMSAGVDMKPLVKVFAFEPGARLVVSGLAGGVSAEATTAVRTNKGRAFEFRTRGIASPDGVALLRLPYASGWNGAVSADPWTIRVGEQTARVVITEEAVVAGLTVRVQFGPNTWTGRSHGAMRTSRGK